MSVFMQHYKICKACWSKWVNEKPVYVKTKKKWEETKFFRSRHINSAFCINAIVDYHHAFDKKGKEVDPGYEYYFKLDEECPYFMEHIVCESTKPNGGNVEEWQQEWDFLREHGWNV